MNKLVIYWGEKTSQYFYWHKQTSAVQNQPIHALESQKILKDDLISLADMAAHTKVELVISAKDIHFANLTVPGTAQRHLRKAIPYMLEEQIASSVDDLFVAIGDRQKDQTVPVRAILQTYLQEIIEKFNDAEINLSKISVDLDCLTTVDDEWKVILLDNQCLVVESSGKAWHCDNEDFSWLVQKELNQKEDEEENDNTDLAVAIPITIVGDNQEVLTLFKNNLPAGRFAPSVEAVDSVYQVLLANNNQAINLLQAEFEPKSENSALKKLLSKVAVVFAVLFVGFLINQGSQIYTLSAKAEMLETQKEKLWARAFPGRKMPKTSNRQIQSTLRSLTSVSGDNEFLTMLDDVTAKINNLSQLYPTNISYEGARQELRLDLIGSEYEVLNQYRDQLTSSGYKVDMNSATQRGDGYSSRFIISKPTLNKKRS